MMEGDKDQNCFFASKLFNRVIGIGLPKLDQGGWCKCAVDSFADPAIISKNNIFILLNLISRAN